jgi:hypothetical protein
VDEQIKLAILAEEVGLDAMWFGTSCCRRVADYGAMLQQKAMP